MRHIGFIAIVLLVSGLAVPALAQESSAQMEAELKMLRAQVARQADLAREVDGLKRENAELKKELADRDKTIEEMKAKQVADKADAPTSQPVKPSEIKIGMAVEDVDAFIHHKGTLTGENGGLQFYKWYQVENSRSRRLDGTFENGKMQSYEWGKWIEIPRIPPAEVGRFAP